MDTSLDNSLLSCSFTRGKPKYTPTDYQNIIRRCNKLMLNSPHNVQLLYKRATAYNNIGKYNEALRDCELILKSGSQDSSVYYLRGRIYEKLGELQKSIKDYTKALEVDPENVNASYSRGSCYNRQGNLSMALDDYAYALDKDKPIELLTELPAKPVLKIVNTQWVSNSAKKQLTPQRTYQSKCTGRQILLPQNTCQNRRSIEPPTQAKAPKFIQHIKRKFELEESSDSLSTTMKLADSSLVSSTQEGRSTDYDTIADLQEKALEYKNKGKWQKALEVLNNAVDIDQSNPELYAFRGLVLRKLEYYSEASGDLTILMQLEGESVVGLQSRAFCYAKVGDFQRAIRDYTHLLSINEDDIHSYHNRAILYERLGQFQMAIDDFSTIIAKDPYNASSYFNRGCCYDKIGLTKEAISDYREALNLDYNSTCQQLQHGNQLQTRLPVLPVGVGKCLKLSRGLAAYSLNDSRKWREDYLDRY